MKLNNGIFISIGTLACLTVLSLHGYALTHPASEELVPSSPLPAATAQAAASAAKRTKAIPHAAMTGIAHPMQDGAQKESSRSITIVAGQSTVIDTARPIKRIAVGLGDYAEASAISPTEVLVNGKAPGQTSIIFWNVNGLREYIHLTVLPSTGTQEDHLDSVRQELKTELPNNDLTVSTANGSIFLRGTVNDLNSSERAAQIAGTAGKVVNLLYVKVPQSEPQILLKVRFASVDRSMSKQLGLNLFSTGLGNTIGSVTTGQFTPPVLGTSGVATISNDLNLFAFFPGLDLGATIEAMEQKGLVQVLAEPNLLAASGKNASFLAGGEYPYPVVQGTSSGSAAVTIMFKEYGVRLSFIPTVTPRGTIRMQLFSEVSSLDFTNSIEVSGFQVPAIATRNVKTEVELGERQSFAIGGLLDNRETQTFQKIPFLSSVPILGKFFQSISKTKTNTELIVIVTPEIVAPIPAGSPLPQLKYPEKFLPPNSNIPMHTPDTEPGTIPPTTPTMPVEKLIETMKAEKALSNESIVSTTTSTGGSGASSGSSGGDGLSSPQ